MTLVIRASTSGAAFHLNPHDRETLTGFVHFQEWRGTDPAAVAAHLTAVRCFRAPTRGTYLLTAQVVLLLRYETGAGTHVAHRGGAAVELVTVVEGGSPRVQGASRVLLQEVANPERANDPTDGFHAIVVATQMVSMEAGELALVQVATNLKITVPADPRSSFGAALLHGGELPLID